jgi:vancomycin resistance protein YoaR
MIVPVLLICLILATLLGAADYLMNQDKIYPGVEVADISLGGKTPEEAQKILEERTGELKEIKLTGPEEFTLSSEKLGVSFDIQGSVDQAYAVGRQGNILKRICERMEATLGTVDIPLSVNYDRERLREGLSGVFDTLTVEPIEAGFEVNDSQVSVRPGREGKRVNEEKLLDNLEAGLLEGKREYNVPIDTVQPELTTEQAEDIKPTTLIGSYRTNYTLSTDKSPERVENLQIASNAITGKLLAPGEVFSVNEVASPLKYNETHVIIEGKEEKADGGGLCQVSSTLYNAANYAGLEIVERHPHDAQLPYIRPGLDATVWFGALDMKFKNTTDGYILLREYVSDDGYIYAEIWGQPTDKKVEMDSEPEYLGSDYSVWVTYQKVTDKNGKVIFDDVIHKDTYKPLIDEHGETIPPNYPYLNIAPVIH